VTSLAREFPGVTYDVTIKIEHLAAHADLLPVLRDTGCLFVTSAVESIDDRVLAHCFAGKDRTGFTIAVVLEAAGVDRDAIMADYLASNAAVPQLRAHIVETIRARMSATPDIAEVAEARLTDAVLGVQEAYLDAAHIAKNMLMKIDFIGSPQLIKLTNEQALPSPCPAVERPCRSVTSRDSAVAAKR